MRIGRQTVHFTVGLYDDGRPGELFIDMHRMGSGVRAWCESSAKLISLMFQYGVPLSEIVEALVGQCTEAFGRVPVSGHPVIMDASGVLDAVVRSMALDYLADGDALAPQWARCLDDLTDLSFELGAAEVYEAAEQASRSEALNAFLEKFQ